MQVPCYDKQCISKTTDAISKAVLVHVTNNVSWNEREIKRCYESVIHVSFFEVNILSPTQN